MSVSVRMRRVGANRDLSFRVVAADSRSPRDGKNLETLGWYDPKREGINFLLNVERVEYWRSKGARISETVDGLLKRQRKAAKAGA